MAGDRVDRLDLAAIAGRRPRVQQDDGPEPGLQLLARDHAGPRVGQVERRRRPRGTSVDRAPPAAVQASIPPSRTATSRWPRTSSIHHSRARPSHRRRRRRPRGSRRRSRPRRGGRRTRRARGGDGGPARRTRPGRRDRRPGRGGSRPAGGPPPRPRDRRPGGRDTSGSRRSARDRGRSTPSAQLGGGDQRASGRGVGHAPRIPVRALAEADPIEGPCYPVARRDAPRRAPVSTGRGRRPSLRRSSVVERAAVNRLVVGSSPTAGATRSRVPPSSEANACAPAVAAAFLQSIGGRSADERNGTKGRLRSGFGMSFIPIASYRRTQLSIFITKRRLVGLISASAVIGSMAVAALPGATFAASCTPTGFVRDGSTSPPPGSAARSPVGRRDRLRHRRLQPDPRHATPTSMALATTASSSTAGPSTRPAAGSTRSATARSTACSAAAPSSTSTARAARSAATRSTPSRRTGSRSAA